MSERVSLARVKHLKGLVSKYESDGTKVIALPTSTVRDLVEEIERLRRRN